MKNLITLVICTLLFISCSPPFKTKNIQIDETKTNVVYRLFMPTLVMLSDTMKEIEKEYGSPAGLISEVELSGNSIYITITIREDIGNPESKVGE
jgi:hypothetical protein